MGRLNAGERNIDQLWRAALEHYLQHDPENDCFWDCEDDMEEVIEAFWDVFSDADSPFYHGNHITAGIHTGDGSSVTHFFAGAAYEGAFELGDTAQDVFEKLAGDSGELIDFQSGDSPGGDWLSDTAYAYAGADLSDYFDTWTESECRRRVKEFTSGAKTFTGLLGTSSPQNTEEGLKSFRKAFQEALKR